MSSNVTKLSANQTIESLSRGGGNSGRSLVRPYNGAYYSSSGSETGYLKITLPQSWNNAMIMMTVDLYMYGEGMTTLRIGGYMYATGTTWANNDHAHIVSTTPHSNISSYKIEYGHDGSVCAIYISHNAEGASTTWTYPQVVIRDVNLGYSTVSDTMADAWDIEFTATLGTITATQELTNDNPILGGGSGIANKVAYWSDTESLTYDNNFHYVSGQLGIGTNTPSYDLHVIGDIATSNQLISLVSTGTSPLSISSTTLVSNLNSDLLDNQQGSYYLDYNNFTNTPTIPTVNNSTITITAGTAMSGGGSFTLNQSGGTTITLNNTGVTSNVAGNGISVSGATGAVTISNTGVLSVNGVTGAVTASNLLTALLTVDGASSSLDSDLLDGQHGSYYLNYNNFTNAPSISGTSGYLPKFTGTSSVDNSIIYQFSSKIGINTTSPLVGLDNSITTGFLNYRQHYYGIPIYSYSNGIFIQTSIAENEDSMFELTIEGNSYFQGTIGPIICRVQGYNYVSGSAIIHCKSICNDPDFSIDAFYYGGYVCFHFEQSNLYQTFNFKLICPQRQEYISSVTNAIKPTSGVTGSVTATAYTLWTSGNDGTGSGLDADTLDGSQRDSSATGFVANSIPLRSASGYLYSNYFNMTANTTTSSATKIAVETSSDGFLRWQAPSQFITNHSILTTSNVSGTANYITKFTGSNTIGNSIIYDNGTNVGVGTASPSYKLDVVGDIRATSNMLLGRYLYHDGDTDTYLDFYQADGFRIVTGGTERIRINNSEIAVNDGSHDYDFRVESNNDIYMLFVNGGADVVGIGTGSYTTNRLSVESHNPTISTNSTTYYKSIFASILSGYNIASGVTDSGYRIALDASSYVSDSDFEGTLDTQRSIWARHGASTSGAGSTITNSYGVHIESLTNANTTITNLYALYQSTAVAKNYFAGAVGIGIINAQGSSSDGNGGDIMLNVNGNIAVETGKYIQLDDGYRVHGYLQYVAGDAEYRTKFYGHYGLALGTRSGANALIVRGDSNYVGINNASPSYQLDVSGHIRSTGYLYLTTTSSQIIGGFGAVTTSGTNDWNDSTNARSGNGYTLLNNGTNGPASSQYHHAFNFEYSLKDGTGNMTQFAIPYRTLDTFYGFRSRQAGIWSSWVTIWTSANDGTSSGLDSDLLDGQHGSYYLDYTNFTNTPSIPTVNNSTITITAGTGLSGGGSFTLNQSGSGSITLTNAGVTSVNGVTGAVTASNLLTALLTVDGSGSGLDADTVDGIQGSNIVKIDSTQTITGTKIFNDGPRTYGTLYWIVSSSDAAIQRADARDDATNYARLHWYGLNDVGATSNFRHAWYDGSAYINVTANSGAVTFKNIKLGDWSGGSTYQGLYHANHTSGEYIIINNDADTFISAATGSNVNIHGGGNIATHRIVVSPSARATASGSPIVVASDISGTSGYLPKYTGSATMGNSLIYDNGSNIGIFNTSPSYKLDINDDATIGQGLRVLGGGSGGELARFERDVGASGAIVINASGGDAQMYFASSNTFAIGVDGSDFKISDNSAIGTNDRFIIDSSGNIGVGVSPSGFKLNVNGSLRTASDLTVVGNIASAQSITASGTITFSGLAAGTDNTVVVLNGSNQLVTDEIDSRVWGASLVDGSGSASYITKWSDGNTVSNSLLYDTGSSVGVLSNAYGIYRSSHILSAGGANKHSGGTSADTGYIKITLPNSWTNTMVSMWVDLFEYGTYRTCSFHLSGYTYSVGSSWYNTTACVYGSYLNTNADYYKVEFAHDGSNCCIYISKAESGASTVWSYAYPTVRDVTANHSNVTYSLWDAGWSLSTTDDGTGKVTTSTQNVYQQITKANVTGSTNYIPKFTATNSVGNSVLYQSGSYIGVGTTSPSEVLEVNGNLEVGQSVKVAGKEMIEALSSGTDVYIHGRIYNNIHLSDGVYLNYNSAGTTAAHCRFYANATNLRGWIDASTGNWIIGSGSANSHKLLIEGTTKINTSLGINGDAGTYSSKLHIVGDGSNPVVSVSSANVDTSTSSSGKTFYGWLPIKVDGTTRYIQIYS